MCGARRLLLIETYSLAYTGRRVPEGKQKSPSPEESRRLKPLGRSFSPLTANTPRRTYDSASVAPKASKKKGRSPSSSLDHSARLTHDVPQRRMCGARRPQLTDEITVSCLHRTSGSWREAKSQSAARLACRSGVATPLLGKVLRTTFVELLYVLDCP